MSNWSNPTNTTNYVDVLTQIKDRDSDLARGMDPKAGYYINNATTTNATPTNPILYSIRWNGELKKDQIFNGTSWVDKTDTYAISITGSANTITTTLPINKGGTGSTTASTARTSLGVPSTTGSGASGTWGISISGSANKIVETDRWSVEPSGASLYFKYNGVNKGRLDSDGTFNILGKVVATDTAL